MAARWNAPAMAARRSVAATIAVQVQAVDPVTQIRDSVRNATEPLLAPVIRLPVQRDGQHDRELVAKHRDRAFGSVTAISAISRAELLPVGAG
jgi:hypothetical protein